MHDSSEGKEMYINHHNMYKPNTNNVVTTCGDMVMQSYPMVY